MMSGCGLVASGFALRSVAGAGETVALRLSRFVLAGVGEGRRPLTHEAGSDFDRVVESEDCGATGEVRGAEGSRFAAQGLGLPRVLLVDDDPDLLIDLHEGLAGLGVSSAIARSGAEALECVQVNDSLDVIVTDLQLPGMDGLELLQKLSVRRKQRPMVAVVMTDQASIEHAVGALRLQAVDFLQKPVDATEVAASVRRAFDVVGVAAERSVPGRAGAASRVDLLRALVAARGDRLAIFDGNLFSDPAWEMMLDLALAEANRRTISVTSLCIASGAPTTTALRRIEDLRQAGLVEKMPDVRDKRRIVVRLTAGGRERMEAFVVRQAERLGVSLVQP